MRPSHAEVAIPLSDYIVPPADARGQTLSISVSVPPTMRRLASVIRQNESLPFRTEQDVMRWAIHHGLGVLIEKVKDKIVTAEYRTLNGMVQTASYEEEQFLYGKGLDRVIAIVKKIAAGGHPVKAEQLAEKIWRAADSFEDTYWRKEYRNRAKKALDEIRRRAKRQQQQDRNSVAS